MPQNCNMNIQFRLEVAAKLPLINMHPVAKPIWSYESFKQS